MLRGKEACGTHKSVKIEANNHRLQGREDFDFYCFLIWPFVEALWLGAVSLMSLTPPSSQNEDIPVDTGRVQEMAQLVNLAPTTFSPLRC